MKITEKEVKSSGPYIKSCKWYLEYETKDLENNYYWNMCLYANSMPKCKWVVKEE